ncbi:hypothetical protein LVY72_08410 [Arthrobacter sp. I2-34]|uniref:ABC transporter substrate-binding protein n=1 Tax=Arthrobacter hankyongi TaxID=2904801 RepID=A0ABS9L5I9_9MICC|nr:hypothetical protein [Arthrobacter hankyongi]MCG2621939.1 hypothetical protein [Arthrobacter hankyongi]
MKKIACTTAGLLVALGALAASTPAVAADAGSQTTVQPAKAPSGIILAARAWDW